MATSSAPPFPPDSSVADLGDDSAGPDPMEEGMESSAPAVSLTMEDAAQAGITAPKAGDTYTVKFTVTDASEGVTGTILPGSAMLDAPPDDMPPAMRKGKQSVKSPDDMGFSGEGFGDTSSNLP